MVDGSARERELVNRLNDAGFAVMRAPSSGSATERELPDVLAGDGTVFYAIEAKSSKRGVAVYLDESEVDALVYFADNFGAYPLVGARYNYNDWAFFHPDDLYRTPSGNYRVKEDDLPDGETLTDL